MKHLINCFLFLCVAIPIALGYKYENIWWALAGFFAALVMVWPTNDENDDFNEQHKRMHL